jgi:hypothetical protein
MTGPRFLIARSPTISSDDARPAFLALFTLTASLRI